MNAPHPVSLEDKYILDSGRIYLTGTQALVRLPMIQRARDEVAGLNTAGFISGYRGSRWVGWTSGCGKPRSILRNITSISNPA
jgi:indolepyruvate ferredoxin oxidoreductase